MAQPTSRVLIRLFRDYELDESGVTQVWAWVCPEESCHQQTTAHGQALFWENALRSVNHHIRVWHPKEA